MMLILEIIKLYLINLIKELVNFYNLSSFLVLLNNLYTYHFLSFFYTGYMLRFNVLSKFNFYQRLTTIITNIIFNNLIHNHQFHAKLNVMLMLSINNLTIKISSLS